MFIIIVLQLVELQIIQQSLFVTSVAHIHISSLAIGLLFLPHLTQIEEINDANTLTPSMGSRATNLICVQEFNNMNLCGNIHYHARLFRAFPQIFQTNYSKIHYTTSPSNIHSRKCLQNKWQCFDRCSVQLKRKHIQDTKENKKETKEKLKKKVKVKCKNRRNKKRGRTEERNGQKRDEQE